MPSQVSVKVLRRLDIDLRAEGFPEAIVLVVRTREQQVVNVDNQEETCFLEKETRRVRRNRFTPQLGDNLFEVSFPMSSGFGMTV